MNKTLYLLKMQLSKEFTYKQNLLVASLLAECSSKTEFVTLINQTLEVQPIKSLLLKVLYSRQWDYQVTQVQRFCEVISLLDKTYPNRLAEIYHPPILLFLQGDKTLLNSRITSIVGARFASTYSEDCLRPIIARLVETNQTTCSGLAKGVDGFCHEQTLAQKGKTIAVLGHGLRHCYPKSHEGLLDEIKRSGLLVSEYLPDTPPTRFRFPERNRIIAGLCQNIIVSEARQKSGSLITANLALQENRNVFAIPGPITSKLSQGTNALIESGATPLLFSNIDQLG
ncbi:DNA-processing protein DprA [Holzapfeliella sp. He02]|uniref:DNA-processing protein DprA n=1 Tax=Holzapfeliella saturejae TaxID=3082953 RepID=A0ABU8SGB6_9LACO